MFIILTNLFNNIVNKGMNLSKDYNFFILQNLLAEDCLYCKTPQKGYIFAFNKNVNYCNMIISSIIIQLFTLYHEIILSNFRNIVEPSAKQVKTSRFEPISHRRGGLLENANESYHG